MESSPARSEAAEELFKRRSIRKDFGAWCEFALSLWGHKPAAHHRLLIRELQAVADGENDRLLLFLPPGSAKSTFASVLFPAWLLARKNETALIAASHTAMLAEGFSRRVRGLVREHASLLGVGVATEAVELWSTTRGGQYRAAGVGGAITGFRADCVIADDLVKSRADADSETYRDRAWEWWQNDLTTRLKPGAPVVCIGTRWHEDDIYGRLLSRQSRIWKVLCVPAFAEERNDPLGRSLDQPLWDDDGYGYAEDLIKKRSSVDARTFSALFQQRPAPDTGDYFRKEWFRFVPEAPPRQAMQIYGASDYAVTADGGDYTVHVVVGLDSDDRLWLLDLWRGQKSSDVWIEEFCNLVLRWKPLGWAEETGQIKASLGPFINQRQAVRQAWVARTQFPTRGEKAVRAQSIRGRVALKGLHIPTHAPWRGDLETELMSFPAGKHDDQVDALGLVGQLLDRMHAPEALKHTPPRSDTWGRLFDTDDDNGSWKAA